MLTIASDQASSSTEWQFPHLNSLLPPHQMLWCVTSVY